MRTNENSTAQQVRPVGTAAASDPGTPARRLRTAWQQMGRAGLLLACLAALRLSGQAQGVPEPALKPNPLAALRAFEPPPDADYELGAGDEISITVAGRPELDTRKTLGPDGRVTLPLAGAVELAGKTRAGAAAAVETALAPFYARLSATVGVERYTSNRILLLGAVEHPGIVTFDRQPTLLEAITRGGVFDSSGGGNNGSFGGSGFGGGLNASARATPAIPDRCAIYRGSDQALWVDLKGLLDAGSPLADLRLKRGDVVYVPSPAERYVSVLGQVQHPGAFVLDSNTGLSKLLAEAGGLTEQAGHYPDIQIIQPATGTTRVVSFKTLLEPGKLDLTLRSGDVVFVPESGFNRGTYVLQRLSPLVTLFTAAALFNR